MDERIKRVMFDKELKTELRSASYIGSVIATNLIIFICIAYYFGMVFGKMKTGYSNDYKLVLGLYNVMLLILYIIVLCVVPFIASNTLAKEYESKTIDLLLLSNMSTSDIIGIKIKKLFTVVVIYIVSSMPLLAVGFSVGGVTIVNILLYFVVAISSAMCYCCVGIYISAITKRVTVSALITCVIELISTLGIYMVFGFLYKTVDGVIKIKIHLGDLLIVNPLVSVFKVQSYIEGSGSVYRQLMNNLGVFGIVDMLWIPLSICIQVVVMIIMIRKVKKILYNRHYK